MLRIEGLCKAYGDRPLLQTLNFEISAGEIYGLLGPNGAGKTTTINLICGLLKADAGSVLIQGQPVTTATKRLIGVVPQENLLYRSLTCAENLAFFAQLYGLSRALRRQRIQACLEAVKLSDRANTLVEALSGGMQRRLSLAVALVHRPKLLILDEPTTGLDIEARYDLWQLIRFLQQQGLTILLTTHLLEEAERLCQRIGILKQGQLLAEGTLAQLRQQIPAKEVVILETSDEAAAIKRGKQQGFTPRRYGSDLAFWIPQVLDLRQILDCFAGIPIDSVSRQPVKLEYIYIEVTQPNQAALLYPTRPRSGLIGSDQLYSL
ncbi:MAG: ABC transporter ATP-binding protein [Leptolyngbyaceae cyanobacterium SL_1_1]|nr:ABC transporter ATP-binding protein [Leptolyngbyaceae cyanobacterium RM1_1_2]NJO09087.1 ABC transporter ATP-binding protein [Leptolyngbyaceae cyanobacterium SL_1_1]